MVSRQKPASRVPVEKRGAALTKKMLKERSSSGFRGGVRARVGELVCDRSGRCRLLEREPTKTNLSSPTPSHLRPVDWQLRHDGLLSSHRMRRILEAVRPCPRHSSGLSWKTTVVMTRISYGVRGRPEVGCARYHVSAGGDSLAGSAARSTDLISSSSCYASWTIRLRWHWSIRKERKQTQPDIE